MTKADLITVIADKLKFPWARAELLVDVVFGSMERSMSRGEEIEIRAAHPNYPREGWSGPPNPDQQSNVTSH
jgi:Bacterial DNA-binding protein